jgi:hypothetical protein
MVMAGPALAGVLVAFTGYAWTYSIDVVLMTSLFLGLWTLPRIRPEGEIVRPGLESLRDGLRFLGRAPNIRLQYILDITAMTFGHPIALFPAIGAVLLGGGAITTGALTASIAAGAFVSSLFSGPIGRYRWHGIGIQRSIQVFGAATAVFGLVLVAGALGWFAPLRVDETHANLVLIVLAMIALAHRSRRQRQRDLPLHDDAGRRPRHDARTPAGRLHGRRRGRAAHRSPVRGHTRDPHRALDPVARRRARHRRSRRRTGAAESRFPRVRRGAPRPLIRARLPQSGGYRSSWSPACTGVRTRTIVAS